jgi:uncharacterized damage-inducible protein DinB
VHGHVLALQDPVMQEFIQELLTYNDDANRRYIHAICDADAATGRVFTIFNHLLNSHRIWNTRIGGVSPTGGVWDEHPAEQWGAINRQNFDRSLEIVAADALDRIVDYRDTKGHPHSDAVEDILMHVVNHSTYHRGQLAILFGQQKLTPPVTDYIIYLRE